jgi:hypothetical protein
MYGKLLALGSLAVALIATSLLILNQDNSPSLTNVSVTPSSSPASKETSLQKNDTTLVPLLPSLTKSLPSTVDLSLKEPLPEIKPSSQPVFTPIIPYIKTSPIISRSSTKLTLEKPLTTVRQNLINPIHSRDILPRKIAESPLRKLQPVFTHRSRPIVTPIAEPIVPKALAMPTPSTTTEPLTIHAPIQVLSTPITPTEPLTIHAPTQILSTPITPAETLAIPLPTPTNSIKPLTTPLPSAPQNKL